MAGEIVIQLVAIVSLGVPALVLLGFLGLMQFRNLLLLLSQFSGPRGGLPKAIRPCTFLHTLASRTSTRRQIMCCGATLTFWLFLSFQFSADVHGFSANLESAFGYSPGTASLTCTCDED